MATQLEPDVHADEEAFRTEVQQFLAAHFTDELKGSANALAGVDGPTDETPAQTKWREAVGERCELMHEVNLLDIDIDLGDVMPTQDVVGNLQNVSPQT